MLSMRPQPRATMAGASCCARKNGTERLSSSVRSQSPFVIESMGRRGLMPAALTRMSGAPSTSCTRAPSAARSPRSARSQTSTTARPPRVGDRPCDAVKRRSAPGHQRDRRTGLRQCLRHRAPDARACTGDERCAPAQGEEFGNGVHRGGQPLRGRARHVVIAAHISIGQSCSLGADATVTNDSPGKYFAGGRRRCAHAPPCPRGARCAP